MRQEEEDGPLPPSSPGPIFSFPGFWQGVYKCPRSETGSELNPGGPPPPRPPGLGGCRPQAPRKGQPPNPGGVGGRNPPGFSSDPVSGQGHL